MPRYVCFYVDAANKVVSNQPITSPSISAAIEQALHLLSTNTDAVGIEIWKYGRRVKKIWRIPDAETSADEDHGSVSHGERVNAHAIAHESEATADNG
jgi:hypothetical protein